MRFEALAIPGAWVIRPERHEDERGWFMRAWCIRELAGHGLDFTPLQANMGYSRRTGTVRGMHLQEVPAAEAKLVRCTRGAMFDVILDLRPSSPTYRQWHGEILSAENGCMLFVPELCAHGYQTMADDTEMYYLTSALYAPGSATGVRHDDPTFGIRWPLAVAAVSEQDRAWPLVART